MRSWSFLAVARFERGRLGFVVTGVLDREQDAAIGFIGKLPQQLSLLVVILDEGQSSVSDGARSGQCCVLDIVTPAEGQAADPDRRSYR